MSVQRKSPARVEQVISEQFLAAELDEMEKLQAESEEINYEYIIVWRNVAWYVFIHVGALIGLHQLIFEAKWQTVVFTIFLYFFSSLGITAGAHRLWSHRSYKAKTPLRVLLMIMNCVAHQNSAIEWARDHRCHHKWTDTDADPHNAKRGFFFSHIGWLMLKQQGAKLDLSDLYADPVAAFQQKYYKLLVVIFCFLLPTAIPMKLWGESAFIAFCTAGLLRYCAWLNAIFLINSAAHAFGYRPYDAKITPSENIWTNLSAVGEGGHNFHHTFPQDYRASEYPLKFNWTRVFIDLMAQTGQVYDRRWVADEIVERQVSEQGDGTIRSKEI